MPMYEFFCQDCHSHFTERRSFERAPDLARCACGSENTRKVQTAIAVVSGQSGAAGPRSESIPLNLASGGGCGCGQCSCGA